MLILNLLRRMSTALFLYLVIPLALVATLEYTLRLAGVGVSTRLFTHHHLDGESFLTTNTEFYQRFFKVPLEQMSDEVEWVLPTEKSRSVYRIFVFGGSAIYGTHDFAFGPCRFLELQLEHVYPDMDAQVFVIAVPAMNSTTMRQAAAECASHDPDLYLCAMGTNEVIGPFGGINLKGDYTPWSDWYVRARLWSSNFRLVQAATSKSEKLWQFVNESDGTLKFGPEDARLDPIFQRFRNNLMDIIEYGIDAEASVLLMTEPANLRDFPPTLSQLDPALTDRERERWQSDYELGLEQKSLGNHAGARAIFEQMLAVDDRHAELRFRLGEVCLSMGDSKAALIHFQAACDFDGNPYRSTQRTYDIVADVVDTWDQDEVELADVASALNERSPDGVCGHNFIWDNCHFNIEGSHAVAEELLDAIVPMIPEEHFGEPQNEELSLDECKALLGWSPKEEHKQCEVVHDVYDGIGWSLPPGLMERIARAQEFDAQYMESKSEEAYRRAVENRPDDPHVRARYLKILFDKKLNEERLAESQAYLAHHPFRRDALRYFAMAQLYGGQAQKAEEAMERLLRAYPDECTPQLGEVYLSVGRADEALSVFERAILRDPANEGLRTSLIGAAEAAGKPVPRLPVIITE